MVDCNESYMFPHHQHNYYRIEANRLKSYKDWPCPWMKPERLAAAGFYYTGVNDRVKCFACSVEILQWQPDDDPIAEHLRWYGGCRFVRSFVPYRNDLIHPDTILVSSSEDVCGPYNVAGYDRVTLSSSTDDLHVDKEVLSNLALAEFFRRPKYAKYVDCDARLRSFDNWPISKKQRTKDLAEAGFYYTGNGDETMCFHCGGGLKNWEHNDDPWQEHARLFQCCPYVLSIGGKFLNNKAREANLTEQINKLHVRDMPVTGTSSPNSVAPGDGCGNIESVGSADASESRNIGEPIDKAHKDKLDDQNFMMCRICCSREIKTMFLPCRHLMSCIECAKNMKICGACHKPIHTILKVYNP